MRFQDEEAIQGSIVSRGRETDINLVAVDAAGRQASMNVPLEIFREMTLHYDGALDRVVERERPRMEHDCIPAGNLPRNYSFRVTTSETRSQDFGVNLNPNLGGQLGFVRGINFSLAFGIDARESVSKSQEVGKDLSTEIIPGQFAVSYTQASKTMRIVSARVHDQCGRTFDGGDIRIAQWSWAPELATGNECPPPTHFPPAGECFQNCEVTSSLSGTEWDELTQHEFRQFHSPQAAAHAAAFGVSSVSGICTGCDAAACRCCPSATYTTPPRKWAATD